jgi:hypothetical protein
VRILRGPCRSKTFEHDEYVPSILREASI